MSKPAVHSKSKKPKPALAIAKGEQLAAPAIVLPEATEEPRLGASAAEQVQANPRIIVQPKRKTLVTWSGGLDSTYGLIRTLKETDDQVFVHHIHRVAPHDLTGKSTNSWRFEAEAVNRMLPLIRATYRNFAYSESLVDLRTFPQFAPDALTVMLFAAAMAKKLGFRPDDQILDVMNSDEDAPWSQGSLSGALLRMNAIQVLKLTWRSETVPKLATLEHIPSKLDEIRYIPREILAFNASCRDPKLVDGQWKICGLCPKCQSIAAAKRQLSDVSQDAKEKHVASAESSAVGWLKPDGSAGPFESKQILEVRPTGQIKRLVMWSGGPASTQGLRRALIETRDQVHVHHVKVSDRMDGADATSFGGHNEFEIDRKLSEIRQETRPFNVTFSTIGPMRVLEHIHPMSVVAYFAAQAARSWRMQANDRIEIGIFEGSSKADKNADPLYRSGELIAAQMIKAVTRSEEGPVVIASNAMSAEA